MPTFAPAAALRAAADQLRAVHRRNLSTLRAHPWREVSGGFGDIGTFIPLFIGLAAPRADVPVPSISAGSTLVVSGVANVLTGAVFGLPLPVQPMKAIAAAALADAALADPSRVASAGLFVAAAVVLLCLTGLVPRFTRAVPLPVVKGIQVGTGVSLAQSGMRAMRTAWAATRAWPAVYGDSIDALVFWAAAALLLLCTLRPRLHYVGLVMSVAAVAAAIYVVALWLDAGLFEGLGWWRPAFTVPSERAFLEGMNMGIGQLPLTALNSIVAVVYLADDLLPEAPAPSATAVGLSVAAMNLVGCWFRAMPVCHGSGGLAAQYRFGARSGASVMVLGLLKVVLGLGAADLVVQWCSRFPPSVLGILLVLSGVELIRLGETVNAEDARDLWQVVEEDEASASASASAADAIAKRFVPPDACTRRRRYLLMMVTVAAMLGANVGVGFLAGMGLWLVYWLQDWDERRREGQIQLQES